MNNKQVRLVSKQTSKQAANPKIKQKPKSSPFSVHIISATLPSKLYALNVTEGIYGMCKKDYIKLWRFYWGRLNIDVIKFLLGSTPEYAEENSISIPENLPKAHRGLVCNVSPRSTSSVTGEERLAVAEFSLAFNVIIQAVR